MNKAIFLFASIFLLGAGCISSHGDETYDFIGTAKMLEDETIVLNLRAEDVATATLGHAQFVYPKDHPKYGEILAHIGEISPGETKGVRPWPDKSRKTVK